MHRVNCSGQGPETPTINTAAAASSRRVRPWFWRRAGMGDMGLTIQGGSSDDDDDEVPACVVASLRPNERARAHRMGWCANRNQRDSFMLSQSGTFNLADFKMNKSGMSERSAPTPQPAPGGHQVVIDVATIEELELMEVSQDPVQPSVAAPCHATAADASSAAGSGRGREWHRQKGQA